VKMRQQEKIQKKPNRLSKPIFKTKKL
jgi:hypothetical protein